MTFRALFVSVIFVAVSALLSLANRGPERIGITDPNQRLFPDSSVLSFEHLLQAPAGRHGFLQVRNGKFAWPAGKRARFWGVNVSNQSVWVDRPTIDRVVEVFARAGCNMVRFEAIDSRGALLDIPGSSSSRRIDPAKLATLDYWIARLRERGIYYYLDLLDFRTFKEGDDVPAHDLIGRAAKPYAFFDRRLIDLQKEFAQQLLTHKNPLTGLRYVDDPALALVEICNEHGFFMKANILDQLVEPYNTGLRQLWNQWLLKQHGSRAGIAAAWGKLQGENVLADSEDPAAYSVKLPLFSSVPASLRQDSSVIDVRRAPARLRDGVRFLYESQRAYFREMRAFLRSIGVKVPITGVVSNEIIPDVASAAAELDFTSENYYGDHPAFGGADWNQGQYYYNNSNPLRMSSFQQFAPWITALRWENKPVVVRELATVWPNRYRAVGIPEAAAYASMQDIDAVLLFGYRLVPNPDELSDFDHQADPAVWGLFGMAAQSYLRGDVAASRHAVTINYTPDSMFRWPNVIGDINRLSWFARLNNRFVTRPAAGSGAARKPAARHAIDVDPAADLATTLNRMKTAGAPVHAGMLNPPNLLASTGQIERRVQDGLLKVLAPRTIAIAGEIPVHRALKLGPFSLTSATPIGALMAVSLDGRPLAESRQFVVKMVSGAENTGQELVPGAPGAPARYHLKQWGKAPIRTNGQSSSRPTILKRGDRELLRIGLTGGTWELVIRGSKLTLVCDTDGIRGAMLGRAFTTRLHSVLTVDAEPPTPNARTPLKAALRR